MINGLFLSKSLWKFTCKLFFIVSVCLPSSNVIQWDYFFSFFLTCFKTRYLHCFLSDFVQTFLVYILSEVEEPYKFSGPYNKGQEKKKDIWPSPMTKPPIPTENSKTKGQHTQTPPKTSITQRLRTDLGRSVRVTSNPTGVVKPVYGIPTFPLTAKAV